MRHRKKGVKFSRKKDERKMFMKSLCRNLVLHEKIETTPARAKELRSLVERLITRARKDGLPARRTIYGVIGTRGGKKLCDTIAPRYVKRPGGYTRITKRAPRAGGSRPRAIVTFV